MTCLGPDDVAAGTAADCTALINAYLASPANEASIASTTTLNGGPCALIEQGGQWMRADTASHVPFNSATACTTTYASNAVFSCQCDTLPVITGVAATQSGVGDVTVTGTTDTPGFVYCVVGTAGATHTAATVKSQGDSHKAAVAIAGSFSVTVPSVLGGGGSKTAACVGESSNGVVSSTAEVSPSFEMGACSP